MRYSSDFDSGLAERKNNQKVHEFGGITRSQGLKTRLSFRSIHQRKFRFMVGEVPNFAQYTMGAWNAVSAAWGGLCELPHAKSCRTIRT